MQDTLISVSDFIALTNQTLEYAYPNVTIEGEVSSFKVNSGKFVFFDLKDEESSVGCFMMLFSLRVPIEDGMKVIVVASPKLTNWGKFSLTVKSIRPSGEGAIKKSFELLKQKLDIEGLFAPERKRSLPYPPQNLAVISSTQAAGYADFMKILGDRWGGLNIEVASVQVQGANAPDQIISALGYFNSKEDLPEVIAIVRGGGSIEDLSTFNDEELVRAIATSRVPVIVGVGHETDETLADLAADVRAATPSNAAQLLVPDKNDVVRFINSRIDGALDKIDGRASIYKAQINGLVEKSLKIVSSEIESNLDSLRLKKDLLEELNPRKVLKRGYSIVRGMLEVDGIIDIETKDKTAKAVIKEVYEK